MTLVSMLTYLRTTRTRFWSDSLLRNATYLMSSTAILSILGFAFWVFVAHLYQPSQIGVASALIAVTTLLSNISLFGLNSGLIRYLSSSKNQSQDINAATLVVIGVTLVASTFYVLLGSRIGGNIPLLDGNWLKIAFVVLMTTVSLNSLTDAVFIANRRAELHTMAYATLGFVKLVLPVLFVTLGALGIFSAYILAVMASLALSYYLMWRACGYRFRVRPDWHRLKEIQHLAFHNYIGVVLAGLPLQLIPLLIIQRIGSASVAYFSMSLAMANLLYIIPSAMTQSLLAESSHLPTLAAQNQKRTIKILAAILIPAVAMAIFLSPYLMSIFGNEYRHNGVAIFRLMALSTFFLAINGIATARLNIEKRTAGIMLVQATTLIVTLAATLEFIRYGLVGIGLALLIGNGSSNLAQLYLYFHHKHIRLKDQKDNSIVNPILDLRLPSNLNLLLKKYDINHFNYQILSDKSKPNLTILIKTEPQDYILKVYGQRDRNEDKQIEQEISFMKYLADLNIPVSQLVTNNQGLVISRCNIGGRNWQYVMMKFAKGSHPGRYNPFVVQSMANYQAKIHQSGLTYQLLQMDNNQSPTSWRNRLLTYFAPQGVSHFDYDGGNILINSDSNQVSCILDFESVRYGPLVSCIYFTLVKICEVQKDVSLLRKYLYHYQKVRKLKPREKIILTTALAFRYRSFKMLLLPF